MIQHHEVQNGIAGLKVLSSGHEHLIQQFQTALPEDPWVSIELGDVKQARSQSKQASLQYEVCLLIELVAAICCCAALVILCMTISRLAS